MTLVTKRSTVRFVLNLMKDLHIEISFSHQQIGPIDFRLDDHSVDG